MNTIQPYKKGRELTDQDKKELEDIYYWMEKNLNDYRNQPEWYANAALSKVANQICDYFMRIGYWTDYWEKK